MSRITVRAQTSARWLSFLLVFPLAFLLVVSPAMSQDDDDDDEGESKKDTPGMTIVDNEKFSIQATALIQTQIVFDRENLEYRGPLQRWQEDRTDLTALTDQSSGRETSADLRRARIGFQGRAYEEWLHFAVEVEGRGSDDAFGNPMIDDFDLLDAYIEARPNEWVDVRVGQFRTPFDMFLIAEPWQQLFAVRPAATRMLTSPEREVGISSTFHMWEGMVNATVAWQDGADTDSPTVNDEDIWSARVELSNKGGFDYDLSPHKREEDQVDYVVGVGLVSNQEGFLDANSGGLCFPGTFATCERSDHLRDAFEVFGAVRGKTIQLNANLSSYKVNDGRWENLGAFPTISPPAGVGVADLDLVLADSDYDVLQFEAAYSASPRIELVGRYVKISEDEPRLVDPFAASLGGPTLTATGTGLPPVDVDRPALVEADDRFRQYGFGINGYVIEDRLKFQIGWLSMEQKTEINDVFLSYVPDVGRGTPPATAGDFEVRDGRRFRKVPRWYFLASLKL